MKRIAALVLCLLLLLAAGCQPSQEALLAQGIVAQAYDLEALCDKVETAILRGQGQIDINYLGRRKSVERAVAGGMQQLRDGLRYAAARFLAGYEVTCNQAKGYVATHIALEFADTDLLADMPREEAGGLLVEAYDGASLESLLTHMMETKQPRALRLYGWENLDARNAALQQDIDDIMHNSYAYGYLVSSAQWVLNDYSWPGSLPFLELDISLAYGADTLPLGDIPVVGSGLDMIKALIAGWAAGEEKVTLILEGIKPDEGSLFSWINTAEVNSATLACEGDSIWYEMLESPGPRQIGRFWLEFGAANARIIEAQGELNAAIAREAQALDEQLDAADMETACLAIFERVMHRTEYDDAIREATEQKALTQEMQILRSAYGSLVAGKTVCTGYARAFQALCDALGLPCWTVNGYMDGEGHAWNMVRLDGETLYVDCTFGDTGGRPDRYFLFTQEEAERWKYVPDEGFVTPW